MKIFLFLILLLSACDRPLPEGVEVVTFGPYEVKVLPEIVAVSATPTLGHIKTLGE